MRSDLFVNRMNVFVFVRLGVGVRWDVDGGDFVWGHGGGSKVTHHDFDLILLRYVYGGGGTWATLDEPHLSIYYPRKFASVERWEWGQFLGGYTFERSRQFSTKMRRLSLPGVCRLA